MKLTVLDSVALEPGHMDRLKRYGTLTVHDDVPDTDELTRRLADTDIAFVGWTRIDEKAFAAAKKLKMLSLWSTGYDNIDMEAAEKHGVTVANVPGYAAESIAE